MFENHFSSNPLSSLLHFSASLSSLTFLISSTSTLISPFVIVKTRNTFCTVSYAHSLPYVVTLVSKSAVLENIAIQGILTRHNATVAQSLVLLTKSPIDLSSNLSSMNSSTSLPVASSFEDSSSSDDSFFVVDLLAMVEN